ncbi:golgin subfamily A member 6-like protein 7 [Monomorium pharaonis]|uniref:golgin subfamily A member 6-like protein 7 n=1 Tax=Monomorium pharaonis TaxID=307658 RepID=UPI001747C7CE|nr:golgin subfamily A member 6-like protein 7 [Monomorium pharaonis]
MADRGRSDSCTSVDSMRGSKRVARSPAGEDGEEWDRKLRDWKEEIVSSLKMVKLEMKEELKEIMEEQGRKLREEINALKKEINDFKEREYRWERERKELVVEQEELKRKIEKIEVGGDNAVGKKVKEIERRLEMKEREDRRKNLLIKGVEVKEGSRKEAVEKVFREIGAEVTVKGVRRIGEGNKKGREMIWVKLESEEQRKEVWSRKKTLKGREERILEDWTWKERRMRWRLEKIARVEEEKGNRVWLGYGRIRIGDYWWKWDEEEEVLRNEKGELRIEEGGEGNEWDVMFLSETWADTRGWEKIRDRVPKGYEWGVQKASRKNRKGRAMGGMVVGIRKELSDRESKIVEIGEGLVSAGIKIEKESWRIVGVYIKEEGREGAMQLLRQMMESKDGERR